MNHISDWLTHIDNEEDKDYLKRKLHDVNIRLMQRNEFYWKMVNDACEHIHRHCIEKLDGYKLPHGTSGANLGIPWNIIGVARNRGMEDASCRVMINPVIVNQGHGEVETTSNCGSIRLETPIKVKRWYWISVKWYDVDGKLHHTDHWPETGSYTIQHEVDHNNGILITDRQIK